MAVGGAVLYRNLRARDAGTASTLDIHSYTLDEIDAGALEAEVCIIGSGPAGAVLANVLADRGIATLLVESGPDRKSSHGSPGFAELDAYASPGELRYPLAASRFRGAGGTSNLWTGTCPRFHPLDFEPHAYTPADAPWPIGYDDLEPYYVRAEEGLHVRGVDDTPFAPPRRDPFPRPLIVSQSNLPRLVQRAATAIALQQLPWSDWKGHPVNMVVSHLPIFTASPHGRLLCAATATRILCDANGSISGVQLQEIGRPPRVVRARTYVIAGGGVETARLLLLSRCHRFPDGIGNHSDLVGRCFMEHPAVAIGTGTVTGFWDPWSVKERAFSEQFLKDAKGQGLGGVRIRLMTSRDPLHAGLDRPLESVREGVRALRVLHVEVKAQIEMEPSPANRVTLGQERRDAFGDPGASLYLRFTENDDRTVRYAESLVRRILAELGVDNVAVKVGARHWDHHHMGTCRMGDDPRTSVVDRNLRVHGVDNLYIAGSAPFVTGSVSNPTLTIVALSLRLADHLTEQLRSSMVLPSRFGKGARRLGRQMLANKNAGVVP